MPAVQDGEQRNNNDVYGTYAHDFTGWSVNWGGGGSWTLSNGGVSPSHNKGAAYQTGLNITVGNLSFGGSGEYYKNGMAPNQDAWSAGAGAPYNIAALTVGPAY